MTKPIAFITSTDPDVLAHPERYELLTECGDSINVRPECTAAVFGESLTKGHDRLGLVEQFCRELGDLVGSAAKAKGYSDGIDGDNPVYLATKTLAGEGHAAGEVIYKLIRYRAKHDKADLVKAAAWCYLMWRYDDH